MVLFVVVRFGHWVAENKKALSANCRGRLKKPRYHLYCRQSRPLNTLSRALPSQSTTPKALRCATLERYSPGSATALHHPTALCALAPTYFFSVIVFQNKNMKRRLSAPISYIISQLFFFVKFFCSNFYAFFCNFMKKRLKKSVGIAAPKGTPTQIRSGVITDTVITAPYQSLA